MSDIGATSPGRWQATHLAYTIGATSALNVGAPAVAEADCCGAPLVTVEVIPSHTIPRNTSTRERVSNLLNLMRYILLLIEFPQHCAVGGGIGAKRAIVRPRKDDAGDRGDCG